MVARRKIKFFDKIGVFSDKIKKKEHEYRTNHARFGKKPALFVFKIQAA
jgi:hypothetical protein